MSCTSREGLGSPLILQDERLGNAEKHKRCIWEPRAARPPSCPCTFAANSVYLRQGGYSERRIKSTSCQPTETSKGWRKENTVQLFPKKVSLLSRPAFFLPFLLLKTREHVFLEPPRWSMSTARPLTDDNHELRTEQKKLVTAGSGKEASAGRLGREVGT